MRQVVQRAAHSLLSERAYDAASLRAHRFTRRRGDPSRPTLIVTAGPFAGMAYSPDVVALTNASTAKLSGDYERELHPVISEILTQPITEFVDIGSAEGYYAVGVAMKMPAVTVVAYEMDPATRQLCRQHAQNNGVSFEVRCEADISAVRSLSPSSVLFSDCEGAEDELLDPAAAPALERVWIVVEVHDFLRPGLTERLHGRFESTHDIAQIETAERAEPWLSEGRPAAMRWLSLRPRTRRS